MAQCHLTKRQFAHDILPITAKKRHWTNDTLTKARELFSRRRWTTGLAQQSNMSEIMPCMCCIIFGWLAQTQQLSAWADTALISYYLWAPAGLCIGYDWVKSACLSNIIDQRLLLWLVKCLLYLALTNRHLTKWCWANWSSNVIYCHQATVLPTVQRPEDVSSVTPIRNNFRCLKTTLSFLFFKWAIPGLVFSIFVFSILLIVI